MGVLIDELLTFSRLGRAGMNHAFIDMKDLAESVIQELTPTYKEKDLEINVGELFPVNGDPGMIKQVWINLISNSLKFSQHKSEIRISISSARENGMNIYSIQDNGAGFDMKYYDKLFGVFHRLHSEKEFEGTGVGLAIVHQVITRHGGALWAEARIDKGATFYFSIPG
jgi:light-regulated signal transduction histidine kinase (bacteriophytochrome)